MDVAAEPTFLRQACAEIARLGATFYFAPATLATGRDHGLDGFRFYILGRGGALGDVRPALVASAFGFWNPPLLADMWTSAQERGDLSPVAAGKLYHVCAAEYGRQWFGRIDGLDQFCSAAERVVAAANPAGLPLFAGISSLPLVRDPAGRAMQLVAVLREFRGGAHIAAVLATGLEPRVAHGIRRPTFYNGFGWEGATPPERDARAVALLEQAEVITDRIVGPAYGALGPRERDALTTVLEAMVVALPDDVFANQ